MIDVEASNSALADLRHARRVNHREAVHWVDALYRVYITGLGAAVAVVVGSGLFGEEKLTEAQALDFATKGPAWLGLAFAVAVAFGLRSGARGGPLTLEAQTVQYELLAPLPTSITVRAPALKQLRFMAYSGMLVGGCVGVLGVRRFPQNPAAMVAGCALAFALAATLAVAAAMILSGHRIGLWVANGLALAVVAWSAADVFFGVTSSPLTWIASFAFWAITIKPLAVLGLLVVAAACFAAVSGIGGISIDDARRRAGLVTQLRFAVTLQDIRTVVLLRRQLAQEEARGRPWIRMKRGGRTPPVWRRDFRSYLRYPGVRLIRLVAFGAIAGVALGFTWQGARPAFLVAAIALYLAGYDAVEPIAQEVDHPSRWDDIPQEHGRILLMHLPAAVVVMLLVCTIAAATTLLMVPSSVVFELAPITIPVAALATTLGATVSTVLGSPDMSQMMAGLGADMMGFVLLLRLVAPPALTVAALAPLLAAGSDPAAVNTVKVQNYLTWPLLLVVVAGMYVYSKKPARI